MRQSRSLEPLQSVNSTADRNINPNPRFGLTESSPSPNRRGADDNCRNSTFWQVFSAIGHIGPCRSGKTYTKAGQCDSQHGCSRSVTIKRWSSNSESGRTKPALPTSFTAAVSNSSTVTTVPPLDSADTAELHATPLRPGNAARKLLAEDEKEAKEHCFSHLPETYSLAHRLRRHGWSTLRYLMQTEVHTYAFSVAANSILSLFPFIVLLLTVIQRVFHSTAMYNVVLELLRDYLPSNKDFVIRNLQFLASVKGRGQVLSLVMLLITSTGIFLPLEVALNSIWGFKKNRSYLMNLLVSLGLALGCGCLAMLSIALTAENLKMLGACHRRPATSSSAAWDSS